MANTQKPSALNDNVRAVVVRQNRAVNGRGGGAWTADARIQGEGTIEVLREERVSGWKPVRTTVRYTQPSDGRTFFLEIDVFGVIDPKTGTIPNDLVYSLVAICPRCGPRAPQGSPMGQITLYRKDGITIHFDENGKLFVEEAIRCPWLCGWGALIREGVAYDQSKSRLARLWSKITWDW